MTKPIPPHSYAIVKTGDTAVFLVPSMNCGNDVDHDAADAVEHLSFEFSQDEWRVLSPFIETYLGARQDRISTDRGPSGEEITYLQDEEGEAIDLFTWVFLADVEDVDLRYLEARARQWFTHYADLGADSHEAFLDDVPVY